MLEHELSADSLRLIGFSFMFVPLLRTPPHWQLPDPSEEEDWYGELWVRYPLSSHLLPLHFGQVFKARCQFRVIMNAACQLAYLEGSQLNIDMASDLLLQLKSWYNGLPEPLHPKSVVLPGHLQLQ